MVNILKNVSLNNRAGRLKVNIFAGMALKGGNILLGLVFIPLVLSYLTSYKYGIWLTINSVVSWFSMMDIGLAGGLHHIRRLDADLDLSIRNRGSCGCDLDRL